MALGVDRGLGRVKGDSQNSVEPLRRVRDPHQRRVMHVPLSPALSAEITSAIAAVLQQDRRATGAPALAKVLEHLTEETIAFFFVDIVDRLNLGMVGRKTVELGTGMATKAVGMIINRLIDTLSTEQLVIVAEYLDDTAALEVDA